MAGFASLPRVLLSAVLLLAAGTFDAMGQEKVGVNSAVNPEAQGTPPGGAVRRLVVGQDVVFNERITTTEAGQTQLLFLDQSAMIESLQAEWSSRSAESEPLTRPAKTAARKATANKKPATKSAARKASTRPR